MLISNALRLAALSSFIQVRVICFVMQKLSKKIEQILVARKIKGISISRKQK